MSTGEPTSGKHWTEAQLSLLTRSELRVAAQELGLVTTGKPDSVIIFDILVRQGELVGRAAVPLEVRLLVLEENQAKLESSHIEMAAAFGESIRYMSVPTWVRQVGERLRSRYGLKPLATVARMLGKTKAWGTKGEKK